MSPIRLRDLRYYIITGALFGGLNGLFAAGPKFIGSFETEGLIQLWADGPLAPHWVDNLIVLAGCVPVFALIGVLVAVPVGYFQLRRFQRQTPA